MGSDWCHTVKECWAARRPDIWFSSGVEEGLSNGGCTGNLPWMSLRVLGFHSVSAVSKFSGSITQIINFMLVKGKRRAGNGTKTVRPWAESTLQMGMARLVHSSGRWTWLLQLFTRFKWLFFTTASSSSHYKDLWTCPPNE